ncbi:MAG: NGG1p interacting factor NIF3 [Patescibacteria group bacterium]
MLTIKQIYDLAIRLGTQNDLRGVAAVQKKLKYVREQYDRLPADDKKEFDQERLTNPYSDTRMFAANPNKPVKRILVGIDIGTEELLLAKELSKQKPIDLVLSHHPLGPALAGLHEVMDLQAEIFAGYGVPITVAERLMTMRLEEVSRLIAGSNHSRPLDAARLLGLDVMCTHTATDNIVANYLHGLIKKQGKKLERVSDVMKMIKSIPEYQVAIKQKSGPMLFAGSLDRYAGKIALSEVTGGTSGSKEMYEKLSQAGIGTIIGMHMHEEYKKEAEKQHINVLIAGHMSSDSLGMNFFLDEIEKKGVEVIPCSGLIRIRRFKTRKK